MNVSTTCSFLMHRAAASRAQVNWIFSKFSGLSMNWVTINGSRQNISRPAAAMRHFNGSGIIASSIPEPGIDKFKWY